MKPQRRLGLLFAWSPYEASKITGARVANYSVLEAILKYANYAHADVFIGHDPVAFQESPEGAFLKAWAEDDRVQVYGYEHLAPCIEHFEYTAFVLGKPTIAELAELRDAAAKACFPIIGVAHSIADDCFRYPLSSFFTYPLLPCDSIMCSTGTVEAVIQAAYDAAEKRLEELDAGPRVYRPRLDKVRLGVHDMGVPTEQVRREGREALGVAQEDVVFLFVGRLDIISKMDPAALFIAFRDILQEMGGSGARLVLAGTTTHEAMWQGYVQQHTDALNISAHVTVKFNFEPSDKAMLYGAADVFVSLADSVQESFGVAPVEAMFAGLPLVLSDWDGYKELVVHQESGYLVPTYWADCHFTEPHAHHSRMPEVMFQTAQSLAVDVGYLRDVMLKLVQDAGLRKKIGAAARTRALEAFNWESIIMQYEALWDELSVLADEIPWEQKPYDQLRLRFFELYKHYPSRVLAKTSTVKTTARGQRLRSGAGDDVVIHPKVRTWVTDDLAFQVLSMALAGVRVGDLVEKVKASEQELFFAVLWMIKNDLLEVLTP